MTANSKLWLVALGAAVTGAILGAGGVWFATQGATASLNARVIKADADTQAALEKIDELTTALQTAQVAPDVETTTPTSPSTPATPAKPKSKTVRQFTYIKKVDDSGSAPMITADYAQMLTGSAAAAAASANGDESPPPNDYYIVNANKLLRKLRVKSGIKVTLTTNPDGTADLTGYTTTLATWAANYAAPTADNEGLRAAPYWISIKNGVVIKIAEQYLP